MRAFAARIGLYRVAALLVGCALVIEVCRTRVFAGTPLRRSPARSARSSSSRLAAGVFVLARRSTRPRM